MAVMVNTHKQMVVKVNISHSKGKHTKPNGNNNIQIKMTVHKCCEVLSPIVLK